MVDGVSPIGASIGVYRSFARTSAVKSGEGDASAKAGGQTTAAQSPDAQQQVQKLKQTDANVRQHEAAHQAAGGGHAGSASFTYTRGPDGKNYATAGEVQVDISAEGEASATIDKMEQVKAAALAPSDPSPQDLRVAAQADATKLKAQSERRSQDGGSQAGASQDGGRQDGTTQPGNTASPALASRGAAAYGAAQSLAAAASFGAARGAGLVV